MWGWGRTAMSHDMALKLNRKVLNVGAIHTLRAEFLGAKMIF